MFVVIVVYPRFENLEFQGVDSMTSCGGEVDSQYADWPYRCLPVKMKFLLRKPRPCKPAAETPVLPPCFGALRADIPEGSSPEDLIFSQTPASLHRPRLAAAGRWGRQTPDSRGAAGG